MDQPVCSRYLTQAEIATTLWQTRPLVIADFPPPAEQHTAYIAIVDHRKPYTRFRGIEVSSRRQTGLRVIGGTDL
jgi:hypothetical protein